MRRLAVLALLLLSSCSTYRQAQVAVIYLKCGGPGGEQNFSRCSWRKTSVFVVMKQKPIPQPQHKEDVRQTNRNSFSRSSPHCSYP